MPTLTQIVFYGAAGLALMSALLMITRRNAVHSALWLVTCFVSIAVLYVLLNAPFLAAVQVIVYAGAIMVLFLFVVMLIDSGDTAENRVGPGVWRRIVGWMAAVVLFVQVLLVIGQVRLAAEAKGAVTQAVVSRVGSTELVGTFLFSQYVYPFEAISILLLSAIIGAVALAKKKL